MIEYFYSTTLGDATLALTEYDKFGQHEVVAPVGRIRRLPESPGPAHDVLAELRELYLLAGEPSMRSIARSTGALSHDTVHRVLTGPALPRWGPLELVVEALDGDVETFRSLWISARRAMEQGSG